MKVMNKKEKKGKKDMETNNKVSMSDVKLIPKEERPQLKCAACGTKLSVKYRLSSNVNKCYCNRCIALIADRKGKK